MPLSGRIAARPRPMPLLVIGIPPDPALALDRSRRLLVPNPQVNLDLRVALNRHHARLLAPRELGGQLAICTGPARRRSVLEHWYAEAGGFGQSDAARDHRLEDEVVKVATQLALDVLGEARAI